MNRLGNFPGLRRCIDHGRPMSRRCFG
jgi:hypothetical protein